MYQQFNEQFAAATRQFADAAAQVNRLAVENAEAVFGLQVSALQDRAAATFAFFGEAAQARDAESLKTLWPRGVQVARENLERGVAVGQEVLGSTAKASEQISQIARAQFENSVRDAQAGAEQVARAATEKAQSFAAGTGKAARAK